VKLKNVASWLSYAKLEFNSIVLANGLVISLFYGLSFQSIDKLDIVQTNWKAV